MQFAINLEVYFPVCHKKILFLFLLPTNFVHIYLCSQVSTEASQINFSSPIFITDNITFLTVSRLNWIQGWNEQPSKHLRYRRLSTLYIYGNRCKLTIINLIRIPLCTVFSPPTFNLPTMPHRMSHGVDLMKPWNESIFWEKMGSCW